MPATNYVTVEIGCAIEAQPATLISLGNTDTRTGTGQRTTSRLKPPRDEETGNLQKQTSRLVATNHNINDVDWLQSLNEDIT